MRQISIAALAMFSLSACSAGTGFFGSDQSLFIGSTDASASANGLPFAVASSAVSDIEGAGPVKVKVVRALTDWESRTTRLLISDETLTLASGDTSGSLDNMTITLGGETLIFSGGTVPASNGQGDWRNYVNTLGTVSGTGAVYNYENGPNGAISGEFDTEAFFAFGYETDPDEIVALVGSAVYNGSFDGFGQVLNPATGGVISSEESFDGTIVLTANFDTNDVTGDLDGTFNYDARTFQSSFSAPIQGNGYLADVDTMTCAGATCLSNSQLSGAFFGTNAPETSGVMAMDVQVLPGGAGDYRFIGAGGFTAIK